MIPATAVIGIDVSRDWLDRADDSRRGRRHDGPCTRVTRKWHNAWQANHRRGRRSLRHVLFQAALAAACHNPLLKPLAKRMKESGKPHKLIIIAVARRLVVTANAVLKTATPWQTGKVA